MGKKIFANLLEDGVAWFCVTGDLFSSLMLSQMGNKTELNAATYTQQKRCFGP